MTTSDFLLRFVQHHPTFRVSELESCALISDCTVPLPLSFVEYDEAVPFAILGLKNTLQAAALVERSILTQ